MTYPTIKQLGIYLAGGITGGIVGYVAGNLIVDHFFPEEEVIEEEAPEEETSEEETEEPEEPKEVVVEEKKAKKNGSSSKKIDYAKISTKENSVRDKTTKAKLEDLAAPYQSSIEQAKEEILSVQKPKEDPDKPYIITLDQYTDRFPIHDKAVMTYYEDDDTMTDGNEEIVSAPDDVLGADALLHFGEGSDDPDVVYVRNNKNATDYEVIRVHNSYTSTVLGIVEKKRKPNRKVKKIDESTDDEQS